MISWEKQSSKVRGGINAQGRFSQDLGEQTRAQKQFLPKL